MFFSTYELEQLFWSKEGVDRRQRKLLGSGKEVQIYIYINDIVEVGSRKEGLNWVLTQVNALRLPILNQDKEICGGR